MLLDIFNELCEKQASAFEHAGKSDLFMGLEFGFEDAIELLSDLPDLRDLPEVQEAIMRIHESLPAV